MPRKAKAQRTSVATPPYNARLFASVDAAKRFEEKVANKAIIAQRGFLLPDSIRNTRYLDPIKATKWEVFCHPPDVACVPVVREFFANSPDRINGKIFVRGVWVKFEKHVINDTGYLL